MTTRGSQSIRYDKQGRPLRVDSGGTTICRFACDGHGGRRKRVDASGTIHYVAPYYERNVGNGLDTTEVITKYYYASLGKMTRLFAFSKAGTLCFVGTDHLGSTIKVTDFSFNALDQMRYLPFGGSRDAGTNLNTDHKFTSQIEDASIGLYWYNIRAYDTTIGRFTAPDTIVPRAANPQSLNRYAYTLNNPLRYADPSGHEVEDWFDDAWKEEFRQAHDRDPDADDYEYRFVSMAAASGMITDEDNLVIPLPPGVDGPGVDLDANIAWAKTLGILSFHEMVKAGGPWDFKSYLGTEFESYGNFHFGIVGFAAQLPEGLLLRAAGWVQQRDDAAKRAAGVTPEPTQGSPWDLGGSDYGDQHTDQKMAKLGMLFYKLYVEATTTRPPWLSNPLIPMIVPRSS